jgi:hypothetical protein
MCEWVGTAQRFACRLYLCSRRHLYGSEGALQFAALLYACRERVHQLLPQVSKAAESLSELVYSALARTAANVSWVRVRGVGDAI